MKIIISDEARKSLTEDEYKFLLLLELNERFKTLVKKARIKLKIPVFEGLREENPQLGKLTLGKLINPKSLDHFKLPDVSKTEFETLKIVTELNIPITLFFPIKYLIVWGQVYTTDYPISIYVEGNKLFDRVRVDVLEYNLGFPYKGLPYPIIQINKRLSKEELFKHIGDHWFKLDKAMKVLEKSATFPVLVSHISLRDIQDSILIYKYKKGGIKYKEIQRKLEVDKIYLDEPTIRKKYSQLNKILKTLGFVTK